MASKKHGDATNSPTNNKDVARDGESSMVETATHQGKGVRIDASQQKKMLLDILMPHVQLNGKTVLVNIPRGNSQRSYPLLPLKGMPDVVKDWTYEEYSKQANGKLPTLQAYKATCNAVRVSLFEVVDTKNLQAIGTINDGSGQDATSPSLDPTLFTRKVHVDGQDNLYIFDSCKIGRLKKNDEGDEFIGSLLWDRDSFPTVHKVYTVHNTYEGQQTQYDMTVAGDRHTLPIDTFKTGNWISYYPGVTGVLDSSKERLYKAVIMQLAKDAPKVDAYETSGWHKVTANGIEQWVYLLPDGRFIAHKGMNTEGVDVRLIHEVLSPNEQGLWDTLTIPTEQENLQMQQEAYDYLKRVAPHGQALMLLTHNIGALLYGLRSGTFGPSHSLVVEGVPGSGKTSLTGFLRCLIAPYRLKPIPDSTFQNTVTSIEHDLTYRSSLPVFVDDAPWYGANEAKRKEYALIMEGITRAVFNEMPVRKRMSAKMKAQRANNIFTLPVFTVEHMPNVPKSCYRRVLITSIGEHEISKQSDGSGQASLSRMKRYVPTLQSWGYGIVSFFLEKIASEGYEQVVKKLERLYKECHQKVRNGLTEKWATLQADNALPGDYDSIVDNAAYLMLYFRLFRMSVAKEVQASDDDLLPHLIDAVYTQMLRMENRIPDEEGLHLFEAALLKFMDSIATGKIVNGVQWRLDKNVTRMGSEQAPNLTTKNLYTFPSTFWGWPKEDERFPPRSLIVGYVDDIDIRNGLLYLTQEARNELLRIVGKLPGGEDITSEKALGDMAEKEGWIAKRQDSKQRSFKIVPPQGAKWVWGLSLSKFLAHYDDITSGQEEGQEGDGKILQFPGKQLQTPDTEERAIVNGMPVSQAIQQVMYQRDDVEIVDENF